MFESIVAKATFVGSSAEIPYTVLIGISAVFAGLICIIIMCKAIGLFCRKPKAESNTAPARATPAVSAPKVIENRQEIVAAVSAAVAEELGTDVSAIRILSFKKI